MVFPTQNRGQFHNFFLMFLLNEWVYVSLSEDDIGAAAIMTKPTGCGYVFCV
jgi:hypothetical protein